jgi:murein DD-endopeptidase MepM/ murein hydrolase activator NlpD
VIVRSVIFSLLVCAVMVDVSTGSPPVEFSWPTPNKAYFEGLSFEEYIQPTVSGLVYSGLYGCVRRNGHQFHEGLDLKSIQRDRKGESIDKVMAVTSGVVRYINTRAGNSNYGKYVVLEHSISDLPVISLYAHLSSVSSDLSVGDEVQNAQTVGVMGRTANGHGIPKSRAHLHLEMGLRLTDFFQEWYDRQKCKNKNRHGKYSGLNIFGFDFLDFHERFQAGEVESVENYLLRQQTFLTVVVKSRMVPDYLERYPCFLKKPLTDEPLVGWRIEFTWFGMPSGWTPLHGDEVELKKGTKDRVVFHD